MRLRFFAFNILHVGLSTAQILLSGVNVTGLSSTCVSVLDQSVACDPGLLYAGNGRFETDATLAAVCTTSCQSALTTYIRRINQACGTTRYDGGDGFMYLAAFGAESVYERYQALGHYVGDAHIFRTGVPNGTGERDKRLQRDDLGADVGDADHLVFGGTTYAIQAGDTCESVSTKNHINSAALLQANGLPAYCAGFPTSGSLCIPSAMQCTPYAPGLGETCDTIASRLGLTKPQLVSWNPEVGPLCGNIGKLASKNMVLCASNPGGSWVDPSPGEDAPTSTTTAYTLVVTNSGSAFSLFPSATAQATLLPNENYVTPFANGSWENCEVYATPPVVMDLANGTVSYACEDVAAAYGITMDELLLWNPGINTTGGFDVPCELSFMFQYCVQPTLTLAADTVPECIFSALAPPAWTCDVFAQRYNISKAAVAAWNPSVGTDCSEFIPGNTYCAAVEHYKPAGTISTCSYWSMANDTAHDLG
ncbi:hypothetical protein G7054_g5456 [Neopestalotiopsis clavispora]|nr:hypothetical protein G7054_g5456 [Neopestalotiopsis clavispora]